MHFLKISVFVLWSGFLGFGLFCWVFSWLGGGFNSPFLPQNIVHSQISGKWRAGGKSRTEVNRFKALQSVCKSQSKHIQCPLIQSWRDQGWPWAYPFMGLCFVPPSTLQFFIKATYWTPLRNCAKAEKINLFLKGYRINLMIMRPIFFSQSCISSLQTFPPE